MIRANLGFMSVDKPVQVIMLTSSIPHSGKSFVSLNLAMALATSGKRVVVIDLDLRRRTLSKTMGHRTDRRGVTSYLTGKIAQLNDVISGSALNDNLDFVYSGPQPPNPTEILLSERMDQFIAELRTRYDYIIIDSVPAMAVADALIVDRLADLTVYVVRCGNLKLDQLHEIEELNKTKKIHNMCVVFNGASATKHSYSYKYNYLSEEDLPQWKRNLKRVKRLFTKRD
jgi:capsular exopolysaccharide synthesis family protein